MLIDHSLWCRTTMGDETYSFPCGHMHWLCNTFFVMHVTRSASGREATNAYRPFIVVQDSHGR